MLALGRRILTVAECAPPLQGRRERVALPFKQLCGLLVEHGGFFVSFSCPEEGSLVARHAPRLHPVRLANRLAKASDTFDGAAAFARGDLRDALPGMVHRLAWRSADQDCEVP